MGSLPQLTWVFILNILLTCFAAEQSFTIDYEKNTFCLDGKPFRYISGEAHYFRMPHQYWRDRLRKMRAGGLNAVSTYVEWSQHEPFPGKYNFDGDLNVTKFIEIASEEGLYVILRPGPYICAERDMGGLPYWLWTKNQDVILRSSDPKYQMYVEKWMNVLLPKIKPYLRGNGGPIIMVQVENEYGYYHACDEKHKLWLRDLFKGHIQDKAVLFTTDPPASRALKCGKIPDVYATVDFGPSFDPVKSFDFQRKYEPKGPLVNSEYYTGWFTHWGEKMTQENTTRVVDTLRKMLAMGANVNFYMYFGGTNFGFTAGANFFLNYQSDITSYDYDAPISEAGDLTEKYYAIRNVIHEFLPPQTNITVANAPKANYGEYRLDIIARLLSPYLRQTLGTITHTRKYPLTFEAMNQNHGYVLYETDLREKRTNAMFKINSFNDHANVYLDDKFRFKLRREYRQNNFTLPHSEPGQTLGIMVENLGRVNSGWILNEKKGILSNVTVGDKTVLDKWTMTNFELKSLKPLEKCYNNVSDDCLTEDGFCFFMTKFVVPKNASRGPDNHLLDSFLDMSTMGKGLVFLNDINLGRFWSLKGPQQTLYVPGVYLKPYPQENTIIVMDESVVDEYINISFRQMPIYRTLR